MDKTTAGQGIVITDQWIRDTFSELEVITLSTHRLNVLNRNNKTYVMDITLPHGTFTEEAVVKWPGGKQTFTNVNAAPEGKVEDFSPWSDEGEIQVSAAKWQEWAIGWFRKLCELESVSMIKANDRG